MTDGVLLDAEQVNFYPLVQHESIGLSPTELAAYVRSCGREMLVVDLGRIEAGDPLATASAS